MVGNLNILPLNGLHDFEKRGYFGNPHPGMPIAPDGYLLPFFFFKAGNITVDSFYLQEVGNGLTTLNQYNLLTSYINYEAVTGGYLVSYLADVDILDTLTSYNDGIYRFRMITSAADNFYSELFEINDFKSTSVIGYGEFSDDFNEDFNI